MIEVDCLLAQFFIIQRIRKCSVDKCCIMFVGGTDSSPGGQPSVVQLAAIHWKTNTRRYVQTCKYLYNRCAPVIVLVVWGDARRGAGAGMQAGGLAYRSVLSQGIARFTKFGFRCK